MVLLRNSLINLSAKIQFATSVYFCCDETKIEMKKSLRESLNMTGLPMVELEIQGKNYWFIVDTGSNVNLISSGLMCEFGKTLICGFIIYFWTWRACGGRGSLYAALCLRRTAVFRSIQCCSELYISSD